MIVSRSETRRPAQHLARAARVGNQHRRIAGAAGGFAAGNAAAGDTFRGGDHFAH